MKTFTLKAEEVWINLAGDLLIMRWFEGDAQCEAVNRMALKLLASCGAEKLGDL